MAEATRDIVVEQVLPHPPETVWRLLTRADQIARWLMPNDFQPVVGHRFTMKRGPMGDWDGTIQCEVLEIVEPSRLAYRWTGGSDTPGAMAPRLDTIVTWTLAPVAGGTRLTMVHSGFRSPLQDGALAAMTPGWERIVARIGEIAA